MIPIYSVGNYPQTALNKQLAGRRMYLLEGVGGGEVSGGEGRRGKAEDSTL